MKVRAVIVDDERQGRKTLAILLRKYCPEVEIVGEADTVVSAIKTINAAKPDLVFLDIEMPAGSGFELLEAFDVVEFEVVFVTAYDSYAIRAIKVSALDYLLKPVNAAELKAAVAKALHPKNGQKDRLQQLHLLKEQVRSPVLDRLALPTEEGFVFIEIQNIIRCNAASNYTVFFLKDSSKIIVSGTLGEYDELLSDNNFFRVHNSHLINMRYVQKYLKGKHGLVVMTDGSEVEVSVRRRDAFLERFAKR